MFRYHVLPKRDKDQVTLSLYAQEVQSMDPHSRRDLMEPMPQRYSRRED